ncbi:type 2 lanthipeptide synthetase LanM family protein [Streptosporangium roseum]|uniref:type 2 lanthipeptide synthetase LanM family protein n=1 Tax=Streptosporangium roseum TaxID=2001 RepID=UPI00332894B1
MLEMPVQDKSRSLAGEWRVSLLPWHHAAHLGETVRLAGNDADRGRRRFDRWRESFASDLAKTEAALRALGIDAGTLQERLDAAGEPASAGHPDWVSHLDTALQNGWPDAAEAEAPILRDEQAGPLGLVLKLVRGHQRELRARITASCRACPELGELADLLVASWPQEDIAKAMARTVVLELNVARVENRLVGDTPEERFSYFVRLLGDPAVQQEFWAEYPVLLRFIHDILAGWVDSRAEFAERLAADFPEIGKLLAGRAGEGPGRVLEMRFGAGDTHRGGRSVAIVSFAGGKIVYKPRSLDVDVAWADVLAWFHRKRPPLELSSSGVLAREGYGWSEFVENSPCADVSEARAFYWRTGALLGLLYALCGTDVHAENLIARGSQPVLIDLEALFHGVIPTQEKDLWSNPADRFVADGVLSVGLLPSKLIVRNEGMARAFEVSAVGAAQNQTSLIPVPMPVDAGTDEMRFVEQYVPMPDSTDSRPRIGRDLLDPRLYTQDLVEGFSWTYQAIVGDREAWLRPGGLLDRFADVELRHIARATAFYGCLLEDSLHPDFLREGIDRDRLLARLAIGADGTQSWERLVPSEMADLRRGDIPFFSSRPGSRDFWDSTGRLIADCLPEAPIEAVRRRLDSMREEDLAAQTLLIKRAFDSLQPVTAAGQHLIGTALPDHPIRAEDAVTAAVEIAHGLCDEAILQGEEIGWIGLNFVDETFWHVAPAPADIYSGMLGMGLFLSTTAVLSGDERIARYAEITAGSVARQARAAADQIETELRRGSLLKDALEHRADPGVFGVSGSHVYYLAHAGVLHNHPDLLDTAERALTTLSQHVAYDKKYDIISGSAGAILAALALHSVRPESSALTVAKAAAARLAGAAIPQGGGLAWPTPYGEAPLVGMSHGASGIAYALSRLNAVAPHREYEQMISGALRYEQSTLVRDVGNWPDLRAPEMGGTGGYGLSWCHGAPGVGLSRLSILARPELSRVHVMADQDLRIAEQTTRHMAFGQDGSSFVSFGNHGICHGDLGNLEFLMLAARHRDDAALHLAVLRAAQAVYEKGTGDGWLTGELNPESLPGLMYGRAGIGYNLLRLTFPERVASVLLAEPPKAVS